MVQALTAQELADFYDAFSRLRQPWRETTHIPSPPPWSTLSGFSNQDHLFSALARTWPVFPQTGDFLALIRIFRWAWPIIPMATITRAIPTHELCR